MLPHVGCRKKLAALNLSDFKAPQKSDPSTATMCWRSGNSTNTRSSHLLYCSHPQHQKDFQGYQGYLNCSKPCLQLKKWTFISLFQPMWYCSSNTFLEYSRFLRNNAVLFVSCKASLMRASVSLLPSRNYVAFLPVMKRLEPWWLTNQRTPVNLFATVTGKGTDSPNLYFLNLNWGNIDRGINIKQHWHKPFFRTPSLFHALTRMPAVTWKIRCGMEPAVCCCWWCEWGSGAYVFWSYRNKPKSNQPMYFYT